MIRVSHELPLDYLKISSQFNDYEYALVHLFDEYRGYEYLAFFKEALAKGRKVILDNSAYEITTNQELYKKYNGMYPINRYRSYIMNLKPTEYILPDVKDDYLKTIDIVNKWLSINYDLKGVKIGVVHGKNTEELQACYDKIVNKVDKIAFSFESYWFEEAKKNNIPLSRIRYDMLSQIKLADKPHHLLGCILPQEFKLWKDNPKIESIDTSAPITNALEGIELDENTDYKPKTTIHEAFLTEFDSKTAKLMNNNANIFKNFIQ